MHKVIDKTPIKPIVVRLMSFILDDDDNTFFPEKAQLIHAMLTYVSDHGWDIKALQHSISDCKIVGAKLIFPTTRTYDYVCAAYSLAEHQFKQDLQIMVNDKGWDKLPIRQKIVLGVRKRLEPWNDYRRTLRHALPIIVQPQHFFHMTLCLYETLDKIWRTAGDTSIDHNFYTKRIMLAIVYMPTIVFWLKDNSSECSKTWLFLDRQTDNALKLGRRISKPLMSKNSPLARWHARVAMMRATFIKGSMSTKL